MLIPCPFCGARDAHEFSYRGDASATRPDPTAENAVDRFHEYVYMRDNPAGDHQEWWYHGAGCRSWLKVTRDTTSHEIKSVIAASVEAKP